MPTALYGNDSQSHPEKDRKNVKVQKIERFFVSLTWWVEVSL